MDTLYVLVEGLGLEFSQELGVWGGLGLVLWVLGSGFCFVGLRVWGPKFQFSGPLFSGESF